MTRFKRKNTLSDLMNREFELWLRFWSFINPFTRVIIYRIITQVALRLSYAKLNSFCFDQNTFLKGLFLSTASSVSVYIGI